MFGIYVSFMGRRPNSSYMWYKMQTYSPAVNFISIAFTVHIVYNIKKFSLLHYPS
jgi:hypothetical protein